MLSDIFQNQQIFGNETSDEYSLSNSSGKQDSFYGGENLIESDLPFEPFGQGMYGDNYQINPHQFSDWKNVCMNSRNSEQIESEKKGEELLPSSPFKILKKYGRRCRRLNGEKMNIFPIIHEREQVLTSGEKLTSIGKIIELASEKFIQSNSQDNNEISTLSHPYSSSILHRDSEGSVQLIQYLLSSAEKICAKQYERAYKFLQECDKMSSPRGSPIERLVFYFTEALYEKIDRETGRITPKGLGKKFEDPIKIVNGADQKTLIAFHKELPLSQITKFAGMQAIVDNIADAKKIHYIDFEIRTGIQCTILMHALAARSCGPSVLKITTLGTRSKESLEEIGRQLKSFAQTLNLELSFNVVMVNDLLDLDQSMLKIEDGEAVAVHAPFTLTNMIGRPTELEHLMRVIRTINPCVMVVVEVEANCNNPNFVERFVEALFFYGASFESMSECFKNDEEHRFFAESTCFSSAIRNIVATEGEERKVRHVRIGVWRAYFARFGFEETELSMSSVYQANLVVNNFACGNSYTFDFDGKSLIIGWKGTSVCSLSVWRLPSLDMA